MASYATRFIEPVPAATSGKTAGDVLNTLPLQFISQVPEG